MNANALITLDVNQETYLLNQFAIAPVVPTANLDGNSTPWAGPAMMPTAEASPVFLTAWWKNLVVLNYEIPARILAPFVPPGTAIDAWEGDTLVSIVGFEFDDVRVLNAPVPFHRSFEEINLRFYVRRRTADGWRRGVAFMREVVSRPAVAFLARHLYGEPYTTLPTNREFRHHRATVASAPPDQTTPGNATTVRYSWRHDKTWSRVEVTADTTRKPVHPEPDSEEQFITDHAYGYGTHRGRTIEYVVEHPLWRYWPALAADFDCHPATLRALYGEAFAPYLESPRSAYLVEGSPVAVRRPRAITTPKEARP